jgi:hypothetical protein
MNWTSTQNLKWQEKAREFASKREAFRLDHVCGPVEAAFCDELCAGHDYRQVSQGSSVLFVPAAEAE